MEPRKAPATPRLSWLTVESGQSLLITVEDDGLRGGLGRGPGWGRSCLPPIRAVQPLDVELEVPIPVEAERKRKWFRRAAPPHLCPAARGPGLTPHRCPQRWQAKGFSLVWVNICRRRSFLFLDAKLHWPHWWGRRLACSAMCAWKGLRQVHYSPRPSTHTMLMNAHRLQEGQHLPGPLATGRH